MACRGRRRRGGQKVHISIKQAYENEEWSCLGFTIRVLAKKGREEFRSESPKKNSIGHGPCEARFFFGCDTVRERLMFALNYPFTKISILELLDSHEMFQVFSNEGESYKKARKSPFKTHFLHGTPTRGKPSIIQLDQWSSISFRGSYSLLLLLEAMLPWPMAT